MDKVRRVILKALDSKGLTMQEVSLAIGKNHAYLYQFLHRHVPQKLKEEEREKLSVLLGIKEIDLLPVERHKRHLQKEAKDIDYTKYTDIKLLAEVIYRLQIADLKDLDVKILADHIAVEYAIKLKERGR
jgi:hypothetical protein